MAGLKSAYLLAYNSVLSGAWGYVVYLMFQGIHEGKSRPETYEVLKTPLQVAQTAALMEIVHSVLGVVRSPVFTTVMQVSSRIWCLWGIIHQAPEATTLGSLKLAKLGGTQLELSLHTLLFAWGVTEVLRYGMFAVKEVATPPFPLMWLRYSTFILLYPLGVGSELTMAWLALPIIRARRPLSLQMPNRLNWGFDYYWFCLAFVAAYLPGLPMLYLYMLQQRRKILGRSAAAAKGKRQ